MTHDDDRPTGPYAGETVQNTSTDWLDDLKVDAKLDGMIDYAKALSDITLGLQFHVTRVTGQMRTIIEDKAFGGGFPEITYGGTLHEQNFYEFQLYLQNLATGLDHSANAARAIADSYGDSDSFSGISLNAVEFAFGDSKATRPDGLPKGIGETFAQEADKAAAAPPDPKKPKGHADALWRPVSTTDDGNGGSTQLFTDQYGETRTVAVKYDAYGHKITTTTTPQGTTVDDETSYSYEFGVYATTKSTVNGKVSTTVSDTTYNGATTTTTVTTDGKPQSMTTVTDNPDGSRTTTDYSYDSKGKPVVSQQITLGHDNSSDVTEPDSPSDDAIKAAQADLMKNTTILAN
jgi:hypothetical protein